MIPQAAIGAIVAALIAASISILTIVTKDFWFPILTEKRIARQKSKQSFKKYANPLVISSISLLHRIREIFNRGSFLHESAPKNFYTEYKRLSSIYRLLALIGWIRASRIELSHVEVEKTDDYKIIENALIKFEESLADGRHIELSVLEYLATIWQLDISKISSEKKSKLGVNIENTIDIYCCKENVEIPLKLSDQNQKALCKEVCDLICAQINCAKIDQSIINEKIKTSIKEMSRVEAWIFRDWQSALGDLMLKRSIMAGSEGKFEVIGYKDFEQLYYSQDIENKKWIERIDNLFKNLDVSIEDRFDSRVEQFKNIYRATYNLIEAYSRIKTGNVDLTSDTIKLKEL